MQVRKCVESLPNDHCRDGGYCEGVLVLNFILYWWFIGYYDRGRERTRVSDEYECRAIIDVLLLHSEFGIPIKDNAETGRLEG